MRVRDAERVDESVQVNDAVRGEVIQPRRRRLNALLVVATIGALMALLTWVVLLDGEDGPESATRAASAGSAVIHDDAGNVNRNVASALIHDDAWNMPRIEGSAVVHDDAGNVNR